MRTKRTVTRRIQVLKENRKKYARTSEIPVRDDAYREADVYKRQVLSQPDGSGSCAPDQEC